MGRVALAVLCGTLLFASICSADEHVVGKEHREGRTEPAAASSYLKGWGDWAQGKLGSYGKKQGDTPLQDQTSDPASAGGWSDWAFQKIPSFSGRASKEAEKATQAGKDKIKSEGIAASKEGHDSWEGTKAGAKEGSEKAQDYAGKAKEGLSEKAKEYAGKAKEGMSHQADKAYEASKNAGSQAAQRLKEDAEL